MKLIKKIIFSLSILVLCFFFFGLINNNVKADGIVTDAQIKVLGAGVRITGNAGLRFVGSVGTYDKTNIKAYGIAIAFGEAEANDNFVIGGTVNDKTVLNAEDTAGLDTNNQFYITLFGIPEDSYLQDVTARAYVVLNNDSKVYASTVTKRNLGEVSLKALNDGSTGELLAIVKENIEDNFMRVYKDKFSYLALANSIYEIDYLKLAQAFIADWNEKFSTSYNYTTAFNCSGYYSPWGADASGSVLNTPNGKLIEFFGDTKYNERWGWLLDYIQTELTSAKGYSYMVTQINIVKSQNLVVNESWKKGYHLVSTICSIFTAKDQSMGYGGFDFEQYPQYLERIVNYNNVFYNDLSNCELAKVGTNLNLPVVNNKDGYTKKWNDGTIDLTEGTSIVVGNSYKQYIPVYTTITYSISYYDGSSVITTSNPASYNVESAEFVLADASKAEHVFMGWYINSDFSGNVVTSIKKGTTGNLVLYAKFEEIVGYTITYNFNGGNTKYASESAMIDAFIAAYTGYYGLSGVTKSNWSDRLESTCGASTWNSRDFFDANPSWEWFYTFYGALISADSSGWAYPINGTNAKYTWRMAFQAYATQAERTSWPKVASTSSFVTRSVSYLSYLSDVEQTEYLNNTGTTTLLTNVYKEGYTFGGWYDNDKFNGAAITQVTAAATLYAKWIKD